ncbi:peptidoglycan-binding protein [Rhodovulum sp. 12E13]|uniref:peptidoglycan-binding domain-containing protein n=1 Tax=Rhodovulum sp. 12E13 TaxID=2203891 RepID=UPI000E159630|nr:peptidoglycan-binding domain-containing protein [Rhodovulum sp. 12E13]RDC75438.1 peptidoglycan-binding protein [Rhodovulum sp. 12E13]
MHPRSAPLPALAAALAVFLSSAAALADRALLIGLPNDSPLPEAFREAGFDVTNAPHESVADMRAALSGLLSAADPGERRVIVLAGAFVHDGRQVWLMERAEGAAPDRGAVGDVALAVDTALAVAADAPGAAFVALADAAERQAPEPGRGLQAGLVPPREIPQGVTVLHGDLRGVTAALAHRALRPGVDVTAAVGRQSGVTALGFLPQGHALRPERAAAAAPAAEPAAESAAESGAEPGPEPDNAAERAAVARAEEADTRAAWRAYLDAYPDGAGAAAARAAIARIEADPERRAAEAEAALDLDRQRRRQVQSQLAILGHEPRGVDGVFGPNTRAAIARFQRAQGYEGTGYLTRPQLEELSVAAARRQAELEAEAERRRLQAEREDRAVWQATGAEGDEAGLRTYLQRFPDGLFAEEAREALAAIEGERRAAAEAADATAWERAVGADTVDAYRGYLEARPQGAFAPEARARIEALRAEAAGADAREAARASERQLGLNDVTRLLVEQRLAQLGLDPGRADGAFDASTRRAIRTFQRNRDLEPTGYLTQATVARMLADLGGLFGQQ